MKEMICIVCPKGCHLKVTGTSGHYQVSGFACERGERYGLDEMENPTRVITSTVRVRNGLYRRCPVKTLAPIPKGIIREAMALLDDVDLEAPVKLGTKVVDDICGTGIPFVTTRDM